MQRTAKTIILLVFSFFFQFSVGQNADSLTQLLQSAQKSTLIDDSLKLVNEIKHLDLQKKIENDCAALSVKLKNYENAVVHLKNFIALNDCIYNKENSRLILDLETKYETEKKELELQIAIKDKQIKEEELKKQKLFRTAMTIGAILLMLILILFFNNATRKYKK